jgi:hypothetical protein
MISDEMLGTRQDLRQDYFRTRLLGDPGCPGHDIKEHGTGEPHRS